MPHYHLSWTNPADHLYDVSIRFVAPADTPRLLLPVWRPGRYLVQNYAANVREWTAGELAVWKDGKSSWRVAARAGSEVELRYRYFAGVLDAGSSFLDDDEAYFNGSNLFMLVDGLREEEHLLTIAAPEGWLIETQLPRREDGMFVARHYDHLIDSPTIAAAALTRHSAEAAGAAIHLVFRGDEGIDTAQYLEPVRSIVESQAALFGSVPFSEYRALYHLGDRWHGVEHEDSCSILLRRQAMLGAAPESEGWDRMLSITSHETFHAWNVKRIVPAAFSPYDYWHETPTRLLWVMEGVTSYYGDLTLVRSGLWSVDRYLRHLAGEIGTLESLPAREHLSLSQASFDAWLSDPVQMHDHANAWFSFYNKGEIVAALLDLTIRARSGGAKSLDDVMRALWKEYGIPRSGLEEEGFDRVVASVADVGDFLRQFVHGVEPLPYDDVFAQAGIAVSATQEEPELASLGARLKWSASSCTVEAALRGGAAREAGLLTGDELLALGNTRLASQAALDAALDALPVGDTAELLYSRGGLLRRTSLGGIADPRRTMSLRISEPSELRRAWLGRDE